MKKKFFVLTLLTLLFSVVITGCNSGDTTDCTQITNDFDKELNDYIASQEATISSVKTRANGNLTYNDLVAMAEKLDSTSKAFYKAHPEVKMQVNENLSKEEIEIMSMDADSLLAFVNRNFSPKVGKMMQANLKGQPYKFSDGLPSDMLVSNSEKTLLANLKISNEFATVVNGSIGSGNIVRNSPKVCYEKYLKRLDNCKQSFFIAVAFTTFGAIVTSPSGLGLTVTYASYCYALYAYDNCQKDAYSSYQDCLK